jgi:PAS domain S-box-containing protein
LKRDEGTSKGLRKGSDEPAVRNTAATGLSDDLTSVLSSLELPILLLGPAGRVAFCNPAATELFGYGTDELLDAVIDQLVPKRFLALYAARRDEYLRAPAPQRLGRERALLGRRKDGSEVPIEVTLSPMTRDGGRIIVCFVTDVSARRDSERRIADYQEKLRQMAFDAAISDERERRRIAADLHDRIGQSLALAQMKLKSVQRSGTRLSAVDETIALLAQSITDTRTLIFELSPTILYELGLKEALSWLAEDLGKRSGLRIELSEDAFAQPLHDATAAILYRAVQELLTNVIKHARARSAKVSLRRSADQVEIDVEDAGIGFDPQAATHASAPGGFGLFSVREQLQRLGGTMEVASGERCGTRVSLRLPLDREPGALGSRSTSASQPPSASRPIT